MGSVFRQSECRALVSSDRLMKKIQKWMQVFSRIDFVASSN